MTDSASTSESTQLNKLPVEKDKSSRLNKRFDDKQSFLLRMPRQYRQAFDVAKAKTNKSMSDMFLKAVELYSRNSE